MKIAIIGAGPAGIALSFFLKNMQGDVWLFEKNAKIGDKFRLTGGGRMNLTNKNFSAEHFVSENERLLSHMFKSKWFSNIPELLDELGIKYKWEGDRAISASESGGQEVELLSTKLGMQRNLQILTEKDVLKVSKKGNSFVVEYTDAGYCSDDGRGGTKEVFDAVVIASGGMVRIGEISEASSIYKLVLGLGHGLTKLSPALQPMSIKGNPFRDLSGVSIPARLTDVAPPESTSEMAGRTHVGDILFTHGGLSGPGVLNFSLYFEEGHSASMSFLPNVLATDFSSKLKEKRNGKVRLRAFLKEFLPLSVCDFHMKLVAADKESNVADLTKEQEKNLTKNLFKFEISVSQKSSYNDCWTTKGGVPLNEINVATMESKKVPGLYLAGEILDASGLCGGYNVSFAIASAKIIAETLIRGKA